MDQTQDFAVGDQGLDQGLDQGHFSLYLRYINNHMRRMYVLSY